MPFADRMVTLQTVDGRLWRLTGPLLYHGATQDFEVPAGYLSDLATVPSIVQWLVPTSGTYFRAAILHDYLITDVLEAVPLAISSTDIDGIFRRIMREEDVSTVRRWLIWTGVRWGALVNPRRRAGWIRSAPLVLAWSLLALPLVLPGALGAAVGIALYRLVEAVTEALADAPGRFRHWASDPTDPWSHDYATCPRCQGTPEAAYYHAVEAVTGLVGRAGGVFRRHEGDAMPPRMMPDPPYTNAIFVQRDDERRDAAYYLRHGSQGRQGRARQGPVEEHPVEGDERGQAAEGERREEAGAEAGLEVAPSIPQHEAPPGGVDAMPCPHCTSPVPMTRDMWLGRVTPTTCGQCGRTF
jgi:hypothetical protein